MNPIGHDSSHIKHHGNRKKIDPIQTILCLILFFFLLNNLVSSQDATSMNEKLENDRRKLNTTIQQLIDLISEGEDKLTDVEVVEAVRLLRRSIRGETLSDAEKERWQLISQLAEPQISVTEYRRISLDNRQSRWCRF